MSSSEEQQRLRKQRRRRYRRNQNLSLVGTLIALVFVLAGVLLPLLLMVAAIHYLFTH